MEVALGSDDAGVVRVLAVDGANSQGSSGGEGESEVEVDWEDLPLDVAMRRLRETDWEDLPLDVAIGRSRGVQRKSCSGITMASSASSSFGDECDSQSFSSLSSAGHGPSGAEAGVLEVELTVTECDTTSESSRSSADDCSGGSLAPMAYAEASVTNSQQWDPAFASIGSRIRKRRRGQDTFEKEEMTSPSSSDNPVTRHTYDGSSSCCDAGVGIRALCQSTRRQTAARRRRTSSGDEGSAATKPSVELERESAESSLGSCVEVATSPSTEETGFRLGVNLTAGTSATRGASHNVRGWMKPVTGSPGDLQELGCSSDVTTQPSDDGGEPEPKRPRRGVAKYTEDIRSRSHAGVLGWLRPIASGPAEKDGD